MRRLACLAMLTLGALVGACSKEAPAADDDDGGRAKSGRSKGSQSRATAAPETSSSAGSRPTGDEPKGDGPMVDRPMVDRPMVDGAVLRAPLLDGYVSVDARDPDAKETVEAGGVVLRQKGNPKGATFGARPLPGLPVDPTDPEVCQAASAATAEDNGTTLTSAQVVTVGVKRVCGAELAQPGTKLVSQSFTWLVDPSAKLGAMVVCGLDPGDLAAARACVAFVGGVATAKKRD